LIENKKKVWIFSFEYAGVAKVGGLGEVPANQAKHLAGQFDITIFMPSHGQLENLKNKFKLEKLPFTCVGQINPSFIGINEQEASYYISFYKFKMENVNIVLVSGENSFTSKYLDDKTVYNPETIKGKISLFSIGIQCLVEFFIENNRTDLPEIVHLHDYHVVLPYIGMKQNLLKNSLNVASILTIHLLTWPRFEYDFYRASGIDETPIKVLLNEGFKLLNLKEIFRLSKESNELDVESTVPTVEKIGAIISDVVTTVSQSYLISDIIPNCGKKLIAFKADFLYDGTDWDYYEIYEKVLKIHGHDLRENLNLNELSKIERKDLKEYLLEYKIGNLSRSPLISSQKVLDTINEISNGNPFIKNGNIKAFSESGPLVLTTGRISPQKGFETIFEAIPDVLSHIPNARFLFLILPTDYSLDEIKLYSTYVKKYPENVRIIFGVASDIFFLAHLSADIFVSLSRWEPFGIMALEAMASKMPIIASKVGGLQETIIDLRDFPEIGTGVLVERNNPSQFAEALISLLNLAEISKRAKSKENIYETEIFQLVNQIPDEIIKSLVLLDPHFYNKIKENCYKRVKTNFTWSIVSKKLANLYLNL